MLFLAQSLEPEIVAASARGTYPVILTASIGGGQFDDQQPSEAAHPWRAGVAAILKTLSLEWPILRCRAVDFDEVPDTGCLWEELHLAGPLEIGYRKGNRLTLEARSAPLDDSHYQYPCLDADSVVLVTGGARGITAEIVKELAARSGATMILLGRTPRPLCAETADTAGLENDVELRQGIMRKLHRTGVALNARQIDAAARLVRAQREIVSTLGALQLSGSRVEYFECDVRDHAALSEVVQTVRRQFGEITAVVHGAGVIEDRRFLDKTTESFDRVVRTKLDPVLHLSRLLDPKSLKFFMLFSSFAAFWGNPGQVDYGAANAILDSISRRLCQLWSARVRAIGWGPWEGAGMVTSELAKGFALRGIPLLPIEMGCGAALREISSSTCEARVLIGRGPWSRAVQASLSSSRLKDHTSETSNRGIRDGASIQIERQVSAFPGVVQI